MRAYVLTLLLSIAPGLALAQGTPAPATPTAAAVSAGASFLEQLEGAVIDVAERARGSVVHVVVSRTVPGENGPQRDQVSTSGVVWSADGYIVSLGRAFENADTIEVRLASGATLPAELIGTDDETGLALVRVAPAALKEPLRAVTLGSAKTLRPGSIVIAVSNPFGLAGSVALGNVAGVNRIVKRGRMALTDVLQISTPVNPGDPGGLLANARGEMVGVIASTYERSLFDSDALGKMYRDLVKFGENLFQKPGQDENRKVTAGLRIDDPRFAGAIGPFGAQGIGFALPVEQVREVVERLKAGPLAERGYLGVQVVPLEAPAEGVAIVGVKEGGPADKAGLKHHDIVLKYDGHAVASIRDFKRFVLESPVGQAVRIDVLRGDARLSIEAVLERRGKKP